MSLFRCEVVTDPDALEAIYRLRHRIYIEQMGLLPADHPYCVDGRLVDPYDAYSHQIGLWHDGELVGTARATVGDAGPLEIEACRPLDGAVPDRAGCGEVTRFMVDRDWRCPEATARLLYAAFRVICRSGARTVVGAGKLGSLGRYYRRIGMTCVDPTPFEYPVVPGALYQLLAIDLGRPWSMRRAMWRSYAACGHFAGTALPALANRYYRRDLRSQSRTRPAALEAEGARRLTQR